MPITKQIKNIIKLTKTIEDPIGSLSIIHANNKPAVNEIALNTHEKIVTDLNVLNICLAERVGNIINDVINNAPITFIPITIVKDVNIEIITEHR